MTDDATVPAGGAIFPRLKALGVDYVFANSGTDFPPIIEGLADAAAKGEQLPQALTMPHEHAAMGMAHGYTLMTGRAQAVMLHTNVGLANGAIGAINAACENIPMILMSGKTPATEQGRFGARTVPIGWGQEMRDQTALVRESCKWDSDLRYPEQLSPLLDRAHAIANSTPKGPVYLSLAREVLCEPVPTRGLSDSPSIRPATVGPDTVGIAQAATWLAGAKNPLIFAQRGSGDAASFAAFADWLADWGIALSTWWTTALALPTDHPCHIGADPNPWLAEADVVLVLNSLAPWWPDKHPVNPDAKVIHIGPDPLFHRFPTRTFRSDLTIAGETADTIPALIAAMSDLPRDEAALGARRGRVKAAAAEARSAVQTAARASSAKGITKAWVSLCLSEALEARDSTVFSELGASLGALDRRTHNSWFQEPHSGGLGWSFPAALGAKLAEPGRTIVATLGDGSYMFANPTACHQIAEALSLPILLLVLNNGAWGAVQGSVKGLYPGGEAARTNRMPLTTLTPSPDFTKTAQASRAYAVTVTAAENVLPAIRKALEVTDAGQLALLDIQIID